MPSSRLLWISKLSLIANVSIFVQEKVTLQGSQEAQLTFALALVDSTGLPPTLNAM